MLKQKIICAFACFLPITVLFSQTGPGGVGSSSNNKLWLDANRGITLSGANVTQWVDQSGNSFTATPNGSSARPTLVSSSINGYPSLDFDGTNDEMWINDNAAFDVTAWHIFIVPMVDNAKDYNAWFCKGNDSQENFEMLSYSNNNIHTPTYYTDATRTSPSSASAQVTSTANIFEYSYSSSVGRDVYKNNSSISTDNESKTPSTNSFSVYIGNERNTTGRFADGDIAEIIMYNAALNSAQRIIVNNYLSAKYNCTLSANDLYDEDNSANGNFDHDVGGIGRVDASNIQSDSQGSGIVRILNPSGLGNNEYYFWGHNNGTLGAFGTSDYPSGEGLQGRLVRVWRGSETGTITSFDVRFDLTGLGSVTASHLRLLVDTDNDGTFADETVAGGGVISGASLVSGSVYGFTGVTAMNNNLRFTLGTTNISSTPLPVELVEFKARPKQGKVELYWKTASEKNNQLFTVQRSATGDYFDEIGTVQGAGNSQTPKDYNLTDHTPLQNLSYYRLKQTDFDGSQSYSEIAWCDYSYAENFLIIKQKPEGEAKLRINTSEDKNVLLTIKTLEGKTLFSGFVESNTDFGLQELGFSENLAPSVYLVTATGGAFHSTKKLIVK